MKLPWFKISFVGDPRAGKSCILNRFAKNTFSEAYTPSRISHLSIARPFLVDDNSIDMLFHAWEISSYQFLKKSLKDTKLFVIIWDCTSKNFDSIAFWMNNILEFACDSQENIPVYLFVTKFDLVQENKIISDQLMAQLSEVCQRFDIKSIMYTSSRTNFGLDHGFNLIAETLYTATCGSTTIIKGLSSSNPISVLSSSSSIAAVSKSEITDKKEAKPKKIVDQEGILNLIIDHPIDQIDKGISRLNFRSTNVKDDILYDILNDSMTMESYDKRFLDTTTSDKGLESTQNSTKPVPSNNTYRTNTTNIENVMNDMNDMDKKEVKPLHSASAIIPISRFSFAECIAKSRLPLPPS